MRFHVLGLPHTKTTLEYCACAYTNKIWKMCDMLMSLGHEVIHYGAEGSNPNCTENVVVISDAKQKEVYKGYDFKSEFFKWDPADDAFKTFNSNAALEIIKRKSPRDFLFVQGTWHKPCSDIAGVDMTVEPGIGYTGVYTKYRVFESYAWMHHVYGILNQVDGSWYDAVIPNYFDEKQFEIMPKKDYYLYLGRVIPRKGLQIVADIAERLKIRVLVCGQGKLNNPSAGYDNCGVNSKYLRHVGFADIDRRKKLMAEAIACFMPTYYLEPFGGVAVEAQMSGTPVITSDWGAFPETVQHGVTGYRCRTLDHFIWATKNANKLNPEDCRRWAVDNYSMDRIKWMYQEYFNMLDNLWGKGFYEVNDNRSELNWLERRYV